MSRFSRAAFARSLALAGLTAGTARMVRAQGLIPIRAAITPIYYDAVPILYAQKTGMFAKAGIDLQLDRLPNGAAIMAAVAGGHLDIGKSSFATVVSAFGHGIPITLIAPGAVYDAKAPNSALLVAKDSPVHGVADLNGKVIALNDLTAPTRLALNQGLEQNGLSKDAVKYVEITMNAMPAAIDERRVDGMMITSPLLDEALATGKYRVVANVMNFIAPRLLFSAYIATHDWAVKNGDAVKRFAGVIVASAVYTNAHHGEMTPLIADLTGATPASIARMTWPAGGAALVPAEIQPMIDIAAKYGFSTARFDARDMIFTPIKA